MATPWFGHPSWSSDRGPFPTHGQRSTLSVAIALPDRVLDAFFLDIWQQLRYKGTKNPVKSLLEAALQKPGHSSKG